MVDIKSLRKGNILICYNSLVEIIEIGISTVTIHKLCDLSHESIEITDFESLSVPIDSLQPITLSKTFFQIYSGQIPTEHGIAYRFSKTATYLIYTNNMCGFFVGLNNKGELQRVTPVPFLNFHDIQNIYYAMYREEWNVNIIKLKSALSYINGC